MQLHLEASACQLLEQQFQQGQKGARSETGLCMGSGESEILRLSGLTLSQAAGDSYRYNDMTAVVDHHADRMNSASSLAHVAAIMPHPSELLRQCREACIVRLELQN